MCTATLHRGFGPMKLYITNRAMPTLCGIVIQPQHMGLKVTHLTIASQMWDTLYIDVEEVIPEGALRFLPKKCKHIAAYCPDHPSMHQLHLLVELYPGLDGRLRKAFLKGESVRGVLPEMWEHGSEAGRVSV